MNNRAINRVQSHVDNAIKLLSSGVDPEDFPMEMKKHIKHWSAAHSLLLDKGHKGKAFVAKLLLLQFPDELRSTSDAYLVMSCAEEFFVKFSRVNREAERIYAIERLKRQISKAEKDEDFSAVARLEAVLFKYLNPEHDPIDAPDWEEIRKGINIIPTYQPELIGVEPVDKQTVTTMYAAYVKRLRLKDEDLIEDAKPLQEDE